jgi:hypothetical protein
VAYWIPARLSNGLAAVALGIVWLSGTTETHPEPLRNGGESPEGAAAIGSPPSSIALTDTEVDGLHSSGNPARRRPAK